MRQIICNSNIEDLSKHELEMINGGSQFSEWVVEKLAYCFWRKREVAPNIAKGNYDGTNWNCGMRSVI